MRAAMRDWEWAVSLAVAFAFAAYVFNPVTVVQEEVAEPVGRSVGVLDGLCPAGWEDVSGENVDTPVKRCKRDNWIVVLDQEGKFQYGVELDRPGAAFIYDKGQVPGW